jgi:hypothetical protein
MYPRAQVTQFALVLSVQVLQDTSQSWHAPAAAYSSAKQTTCIQVPSNVE